MMKIFCPNCGNKIEYGSQKPNFCGACGQQLNSMTPKQAAVKASNIEPEDETEVDDEGLYVPKNVKPNVEIVIRRGREVLGQLMGTGSTGFVRPQDPRNPDEILEEFKKESQSSRPK